MAAPGDRDEDDRRALTARKLRDVAALLPAVGALLLATPLLSPMTGGVEGALPRALVYIFGVWAVLILGAFILSRLLDRDGR